MKLEDIGFYTLCDERAVNVSATSPMWRCELIITDKCNFKCPYCRGMKKGAQGVLSTERAIEITQLWASDGLKNIRYSGGEPTTHKGLFEIVSAAKSAGVEKIAISTNGSAKADLYKELVKAGVNDFSISLDGCCSGDIDEMSGKKNFGNTVIDNIKMLSKLTYVTVGVVITDQNYKNMIKIVDFAHGLGVADIRIISSAQENFLLESASKISDEILNQHPILKYRVNNIKKGRNVRGLRKIDTNVCHIAKDDSMIVQGKHYPCVIYFREGGRAIGQVGENMRQERMEWSKKHDCKKDNICNKNCLDVCQDYNNACQLTNKFLA
jgi:molybdenum cofactor biosynthesis enzyme MoaA